MSVFTGDLNGLVLVCTSILTLYVGHHFLIKTKNVSSLLTGDLNGLVLNA